MTLTAGKRNCEIDLVVVSSVVLAISEITMVL